VSDTLEVRTVFERQLIGLGKCADGNFIQLKKVLPQYSTPLSQPHTGLHYEVCRQKAEKVICPLCVQLWNCTRRTVSSFGLLLLSVKKQTDKLDGVQRGTKQCLGARAQDTKDEAE